MSAATYQAIVTAIDTAIAAGVSGPGRISAAGRSIEYRDLDQLMRTREKYAALASKAGGLTGFKLTGLKAGSGQT